MKNDLDDIDELQRLELSCLEQADKCASAAAKSALRNLAADIVLQSIGLLALIHSRMLTGVRQPANQTRTSGVPRLSKQLSPVRDFWSRAHTAGADLKPVGSVRPVSSSIWRPRQPGPSGPCLFGATGGTERASLAAQRCSSFL